MNAKSLKTVVHLSDVKIDELVKSVGLYAPILVSTMPTLPATSRFSTVQVSEDVQRLYELYKLSSPLYLPCAYCQEELAFQQVSESTNSAECEGSLAKIPIPSPTQRYSFRSSAIPVELSDSTDKRLQAASAKCRNVILENMPFFVLELACTLDDTHKIRCMFCVEPFSIDAETNRLAREFRLKQHETDLFEDAPTPTPQIEEALELSELAQHTLILKKIGQYPSLADMQFFSFRKYQSLLGDYYKELTRAVGLHAAGIGVGAFVYLRRILEKLCEDAHPVYKDKLGWNEKEYQNRHFIERVQYLASFGCEIIPSEIDGIKTKIYSVLSKGVHEYTEDECKELFPYLLTSIELMLDKKVEDAKRTKKIGEAVTKINGART